MMSNETSNANFSIEGETFDSLNPNDDEKAMSDIDLLNSDASQKFVPLTASLSDEEANSAYAISSVDDMEFKSSIDEDNYTDQLKKNKSGFSRLSTQDNGFMEDQYTDQVKVNKKGFSRVSTEDETPFSLNERIELHDDDDNDSYTKVFQEADLDGPRKSMHNIEDRLSDRIIKKKSVHRRLIPGLLTTFLILVIGAGVLMRKEKSNNASKNISSSTPITSNQTEKPSLTLQEFLLYELDFDSSELSGSYITAQQKAYIWLTILDSKSLLDYSDKYDILQKFVLATFYYTTDGDKWPLQMNFMNEDGDVCLWNIVENGTQIGVFCDDENYPNMVTSIRIFDNELKGILPSELGSLDFLQEINLDNNEIAGKLPSELGKLKNLKSLMVANNFIEGNIPKEVMHLKGLKFLSLQDNMFSGTIPTEIGTLLELSELRLDGNIFEGKIPTEIGQLREIITLCLYYNNLVGTIPKELGNLTNALYFEVNFNKLEGVIPTELGKLEQLRHLYLFENSLTGTIPTEIGELDSLESLEMYKNNLVGTLPTELGKLENLERLYLNQNNLSGTIPNSLMKLRNLYDVDITWGNNITGDIEKICQIKGLYFYVYCGRELYNASSCSCCTCWMEHF